MADITSVAKDRFESRWTINRVRSSDTVPSYAVTGSGGVGGEAGGVDGGWIFKSKVDRTQTAKGPDGDLLVRVRPRQGAERWLRRSDLRAASYAATGKRIVQDVEAVRAGLLKTYWAAKMTMMQEKADRGAMVRPGSSAMVRDKVGLEVMLNPDVEYRVVQVIEGRCGTSSEFAVELQPPEFIEMELSDFNIIVPYELLLGTDTSAQEQAQQTGASEVRLSAQQILEGLQQTPEVKPLLPMGLTLTDEQVHYVDGETMGAVFVYKQFPISEEDKRAAPKVDRDRYQEGLGTPGVRVGQDIFIQEDACGIGTEYHEALHLATHYAGTDSRSLASLGWDFNEGVTEYFTRFVTRRLGVIRDEDQYGPQRRGIEAPLERGFISVTGLADAYFRGRTGMLLATFDEATKGQFSLEAYAACIDSDRSHSAQNVLAAFTPA